MIDVRPERTDDRVAVHEVEAAAFGRDDEAELVERLRADAAFLPELSLVAVDDDSRAVVGHIAFSRVTLDGEPSSGIALGPVAVVPGRQRDGIGSLLVREGVRRATGAGFTFVVLLGHPEYYSRFGFAPAAPLGLTGDYGDGAAWMAMPLGDHRLPKGHVAFPAAFG